MTAALQLLQAVALYASKTPLIALKTTPAELVDILEECDDRLKKFQMLSACVIASGPKIEDSGNNPLQPIIDQCESDILISFVHPEIQLLLGKKNFGNGQSAEELKLALKSLIGEVDPEEKKRQLKLEFAQIGRRTTTNETFTDFIGRLESKATEITETNYKSELVADQFARDLRPMDIDILELFPDDWENAEGLARVKKQAEILDQRKMYRKKEAANHKLEIESISSKIDDLTQQHKLEISKLTDTFQKQLEIQSKQLEASQIRNEELMNKLLSSMDKTATAQVKQLNSKAENGVSEGKSGSSSGGQSEKPKKPSKVPFWLNKKNFCHFCGGKNCKKGSACDGNDNLWCMFCEKSGHCHTSRKFHGSKN